MKYNEEKVGMNLAIDLNCKDKNMTLNYYYDSSTNYSFRQEEDGYSLSLDMPGIKKTDLSITIAKQAQVEFNILSIKAKTKDRNYNQDLKISNKLDEKSCKASLSEGVLKIKMKAKEEVLNKYKIDVE